MLKRDSKLGQYKIVRFLGEGGMGAVYEALHTELGKRVALKTLRSDVEALPTVKERFLREGQSAARLKHPHIVDVYDAGQVDGVAFLVMEYLEGEDLETLLRRETRVTADRALDIMVPVMAAVAAVHQQGIIHRDLKPQNVFLTRGPYGEPLPKVLDFGISKVSTADASLTGAGEALGSPYYMSPEQARGLTDLDARSDQFGLGVILYELLTGVRPFDAPNVFAVLVAIQQGAYVPLHERLPGTPRALSEAVAKAMATSPDARFSTVLELAKALLPFAGERTRVLWSPLLGASTQGAALEDDAPLIAAAEDRTTVRRNPLAETGPRPAVEGAALEGPAGEAEADSDVVTRAPIARQSTGGKPRPATPPPAPPSVASSEPRPPTPAPGRSQLRPAAELSRTGSRPAAAETGVRRVTGTVRALGERPPTPPSGVARPRESTPAPPGVARPRESTPAPPGLARPRESTPAPPGVARSRESTPAPPGVARSREATPPPPGVARPREAPPAETARATLRLARPASMQPLKSTPSAAAAQKRRRQTQSEMPFEPEPFSTPGMGEEEVTAPPVPSHRGAPEAAIEGRQETAQLQVWKYELLCISQGEAGATLRARQLIRTSSRLVLLFETKGPNPERRAPLIHVLNSTHGALDVVAIVDDGKGGWRDPMGDLCKELVPLRYDGKNAYVMLEGGNFQHLIRKDLFDPLTDAEKITDWVAGRNPIASRWKRPSD
ncbi:MAG: protein kinase [Myxococcales bacterium]